MKSKDLELARLRGILSGISTDARINEKELLFLDAWLRDREHCLDDDGDAVDLLEQISDVLEDGVITEDEMKDTLNLIDCILEFQENPPHTTNLQEVFGFVQGVVSDSYVTGEELSAIFELLERNDDVPMCSLLYARIKHLTDYDEALQILKSFSGHYLEETGVTQDWTSFLGDELPEDFDFNGKGICFTGGVTGMPRSTLKKHVIRLGGSVSKSVTKKTSLLVVGDECSRGWIEHNYGTKLDAACKLKLKGHPILIVSGDEWLSKTANQKAPDAERKQKLWSEFGDHQDLDSLFGAATAICDKADLYATQYSDPELGTVGVSIHRKWKNGNPLKKRELYIEFVPNHINELGNTIEKRSKPWVVSAVDCQTVSYQKQSSAIDSFREKLASIASSNMGHS